jgi:ATP-binding cassette, subfamily G (WHITE), member 2, PDR
MHPWFRWINYLDPIAYAFEALMVNEFSHRTFPCSQYVPSGPGYDDVGALNRACNARGSRPGEDFVDGDAYINTSFQYYHSHLWRNLGIIIAFLITFAITYFYATEKISALPSKGEVLVFLRGHQPKRRQGEDEEAGSSGRGDHTSSSSASTEVAIQRQTDIFHWKDVCYGGNPYFESNKP